VAFANQARALIDFLRSRDLHWDNSLLLEIEKYPVIGPVARFGREELQINAADIQDWVTRTAEASIKNIGSLGSGIVLGALGTLVGFFFMLFLLFFFIRDGATMFSRLKRLIPVPEEHREQLFNHLASVTRGVFYGIGLTAIVQGVMVGIGFAIAGLPSPVVFGVLAALAALIPMVGTPVVWVPATIALAMQDRWGAALFMLLWGVFVTTIDNFLRPWLVSGRADVGTLTVFLGVLGGVSAFGPIGVILGPLVLATAIALTRFSLESRDA
jgi:predicted PurR-regulated permease PerM